MFSGIVEEAARLVGLRREGGNVHLTLSCGFVDELKIDQSVAHNGVCLTVVALPGDGTYTVTAIEETLRRSNLGTLEVGDLVNVERCMLMNGRLDGHIVQGHVDCTARCVEVTEVEGSTYFKFSYEVDPAMVRKGYMTVEKGSVFRVAIIPYTFEHTNFCNIKVGSVVNLEFDIIGKYICRLNELS